MAKATPKSAMKRSTAENGQISDRLRRVHDALDVLLHVVGAGVFLLVWLWHFTQPASRLPGARGFGWFYKFLTFWSWTTQTVQYNMASLFSITPPARSHWRTFAALADDLSCMAFCVAGMVTLNFYTLQILTSGMVDRSVDRPAWLGWTIHAVNSVFAWLDIIVSRPRTFSKRARIWAIALALCYTAFVSVCRLQNGVFPYPFMNTKYLNNPGGVIVMSALSVGVMQLFFQLGKYVAHLTGKALHKETIDARQKRAMQRLKAA